MYIFYFQANHRVLNPIKDHFENGYIETAEPVQRTILPYGHQTFLEDIQRHL